MYIYVNKEINRNFIETVLFFISLKTKHKADRLANPTLLVSEVAGYLVSRV